MMKNAFFRLAAGVSLLAVLFLQPSAAQNRAALAAKLSEFITHDMAIKQIPAAYVALVDSQSIVWMHAFGFADPATKRPASVDDVHRIASVSKLFTDIALMQLAETGEVNIDTPVTVYLPEFKPFNQFKKEITLRQLMTHRSGLVREPPVGNYFDPTEPTLAQTVASLNKADIVYEPGKRVKYSNAGIGVVGFVVERLKGKPFAQVVEESVLKPLGLENSSFAPRPDLIQRKPRAFIWTYDGRRFDAPTFQFGMAPAANMYSTLGDLGAFMIALFNGGVGQNGRVLKQETLAEMLKPQFVHEKQETGVGLGFFIDKLDGHRRIGHSGDVYGFATEFAALPDLKLGVIVVNTMNAANVWSEKIANYALRLMVAHRMGIPLPEPPVTQPIDPALAKKLKGRYEKDDLVIDLIERNGKLYFHGRTTRVALRRLGDTLVTDDLISFGTRILLAGNSIVIGGDTLHRVEWKKPASIPQHWKGLIGEYGWDHNVLLIHERNGILRAQIEWYFSYPLTQLLPDFYAFPDYGLYHGEFVRFERDKEGRAVAAVAAGVRFERRNVAPEDGATFRIKPLKPIEQLQKEALAATPPKESGDFRKPELVELRKLDPTIKLDIRYATTDNFMGARFYSHARAFLQRPAAEALVRAHRWLKERGYGLLIHDAYRPWYVTKMFWDATPPELHDFVADPSRGSRHNRGCAVDLTLYDLKTGQPVEMVSGYDEFSPRAFPDYPGGTSLQRWHRELLREAMAMQGFTVYEWEWWHFDYNDWQKYPLLNVTFDRIR